LTLQLENLRRRKTNKPALKNLGIPQPNDRTVVPTVFLKPELERILTNIQRQLADESTTEGSLRILAERLAVDNGATPERYARRIYDWRHDRTRAIDADTVDRIYGAVGELYTEAPLPELPAGLAAAYEMVSVRDEYDREKTAEALDNLTPPPNTTELKKLATKLLHFSQGACCDWDVIDIAICNGLELLFLGQNR
jgi:hypothetical protein